MAVSNTQIVVQILAILWALASGSCSSNKRSPVVATCPSNKVKKDGKCVASEKSTGGNASDSVKNRSDSRDDRSDTGRLPSSDPSDSGDSLGDTAKTKDDDDASDRFASDSGGIGSSGGSSTSSTTTGSSSGDRDSTTGYGSTSSRTSDSSRSDYDSTDDDDSYNSYGSTYRSSSSSYRNSGYGYGSSSGDYSDSYYNYGGSSYYNSSRYGYNSYDSYDDDYSYGTGNSSYYRNRYRNSYADDTDDRDTDDTRTSTQVGKVELKIGRLENGLETSPIVAHIRFEKPDSVSEVEYIYRPVSKEELMTYLSKGNTNQLAAIKIAVTVKFKFGSQKCVIDNAVLDSTRDAKPYVARPVCT